MTEDNTNETNELDDSPYVEVSECLFTVLGSDGSTLLETTDVHQAFNVKKFNPGSKVRVDAKVDATLEFANQLMDQQEQEQQWGDQ